MSWIDAHPKEVQFAVRFIRFAIVGVFGLAIKLSITYLLTTYLGVWYFASYLVAAFFGWSVIFLANSLFTFAGHSKKGYLKRYGTFLLGYLSVFWINALIVFVLTSVLNIFYLVSIVAAAILTSSLTFFFSSRYVYRD